MHLAAKQRRVLQSPQDMDKVSSSNNRARLPPDDSRDCYTMQKISQSGLTSHLRQGQPPSSDRQGSLYLDERGWEHDDYGASSMTRPNESWHGTPLPDQDRYDRVRLSLDDLPDCCIKQKTFPPGITSNL